MFSYNHQRHGRVLCDLGIRSHQLTLGTRSGIHISRFVPWIHVVAAEGGQGNNAQSGAVSSCLHGGKAEWPNWTNNDRFCRPCLGRSLAWYTTTGSNGWQSLESFWCFLIIWCFAHCILDAVYTIIYSYSFSQFHNRSLFNLGCIKRSFGQSDPQSTSFHLYNIGSAFSFHYLVKLTFVGFMP